MQTFTAESELTGLIVHGWEGVLALVLTVEGAVVVVTKVSPNSTLFMLVLNLELLALI